MTPAVPGGKERVKAVRYPADLWRMVEDAGGPSASYAEIPENTPQYQNGGRWIVRFGTVGVLREGMHTVTEHEDGTITVEPSLQMPNLAPSRPGWHGYLRRGVFEDGSWPHRAYTARQNRPTLAQVTAVQVRT